VPKLHTVIVLLRLSAALCILLFSLPAEASQKGTADSRLNVIILACDAGNVPTVTLQLGPSQDGTKPKATSLAVTRVSGSVFTASAAVHAGVYVLGAENSNCWLKGPEIVGILEGAPRQVVVLLRPRGVAVVPLVTFRSLAIDLPAQDIGISLTDIRGRTLRRPSWDGTTAYFDSLPPGDYLVELAESFESACIPFSVPDGIDQRMFHLRFDFGGLASVLRRDPVSGAIKCP
jgi:hypothetical protein